MEQDRSQVAQSWVMFHLGLLHGQQDELLKKAAVITGLHEKVRKGELDPSTLDTHAGLEELVEVVKKFQNNASMLMAYCMVWRLEWKQEHGQKPELPKSQ